MTSVWYVGRYGKRQLSVGDWAALGIITTKQNEWSLDNGWSLPESDFTPTQLSILASMDEFQTGQDGPRIKIASPAITGGSSPFSIYFEKSKELYEDFLSREPKYSYLMNKLPELYSDFTKLPDGELPLKFDSGQIASEYNNGVSGNIQVIKDGAIYSPFTFAGPAAAYYHGTLSNTVKRIGQRFRFDPNPAVGATQNGAVAMAITRSPIAIPIPTMGLHAVIGPDSVIIGVWNGPDEPGADGLVTLISHSGLKLRVDGRSEYEFECWIDDTKTTPELTWEIRAASSRRVIRRGTKQDARFTSWAGNHVFF